VGPRELHDAKANNWVEVEMRGQGLGLGALSLKRGICCPTVRLEQFILSEGMKVYVMLFETLEQ
jgi:hypothetical protein